MEITLNSRKNGKIIIIVCRNLILFRAQLFEGRLGFNPGFLFWCSKHFLG